MHKIDEENSSSDEGIEKKEQKTSQSGSTSTLVIDDQEEGKCGYGSWEPRFLQCCNSAKGFLVVYCFLVIVQGLFVFLL